MVKSLEIYWFDLNEEKQKEVLEFYNLQSPEDGNFEINPLCILDVEEDE